MRNKMVVMDSGFEEQKSFSRTPRKMSREQAQFRTRTNSLASNGSSSENQKQVKNTSLYKTELCRSFEDTGMCRYGKKCQFAHSKKELRVLARHPKYKTDMCKSYHSTGFCPYGTRCHFIHEAEEFPKEIDSSEDSDSVEKPFEGLKISDTLDALDWPTTSKKVAKHNQNGLTKNFSSFNSVGSFKKNSSVESIWSNNNSCSNLTKFDVGFNTLWNDSFLPPCENDRIYTNDMSLGLDSNWSGLTFVSMKPSSISGSGGSERDSLSPDAKFLRNDDNCYTEAERLSVFRTLSCSEK